MKIKPGRSYKIAVAGDRFAAINASFRNGSGRTYFTTKEEAEKEAEALLTSQRLYPGYIAPDKLVIVKVVGIVERNTVTKRRKPRKGELAVGKVEE